MEKIKNIIAYNDDAIIWDGEIIIENNGVNKTIEGLVSNSYESLVDDYLYGSISSDQMVLMLYRNKLDDENNVINQDIELYNLHRIDNNLYEGVYSNTSDSEIYFCSINIKNKNISNEIKEEEKDNIKKLIKIKKEENIML